MGGKIKRIFLFVLDSFGIGAAEDAALFGDEGANTLCSIQKTGILHIPMLEKLGLGNIYGVDSVKKVDTPSGVIARLTEKSRGKDTTVGHFEMMGIISNEPFPTYPDGFPDNLISEFERLADVGILCNRPYSGTKVIDDFGEEHMKSGRLIVYTSADSVFQIAAHEDIVPLDRLYEYCRTARKLLVGEHSVARVIARPFTGKPGSFVRTANRRDFSLEPPTPNALTRISDSAFTVKAIGKINDIFAGIGITEAIPTHGNTEGIKLTRDALEDDFEGLCFTNLVDFDMLYGHRQDPKGYALAMNEFDSSLADFMANMREDDLLIITADHGCDPCDDSTDHTREDVPLIIWGRNLVPINLGRLCGFDCVGRLACDALGVPSDITAPSIYEHIKFTGLHR